MSTDARDRILAAIVDHGPISFAEFMEISLYGSGGFYDRPPVGPSGDFVTSPHVHPVFGAFLARAIGELRDALGSPTPFRIVEVGAGDGTLAGQLLAAMADPVAYTAVEISRGARAALAELDGVEVVDELPGEADVVLAHELLDNLPFRVVRDRREVAIGVDGDRFREELVPIDEELASALERVVAPREPYEEPPQGDLVVPVGAFAFVDRLATTLDPGAALLIDYGGVGTAGGGIHGYRAHRVVEDVLHDPGTADITSGVDFAAIARHARIAGLVAHGPVSQHDALMALGFERWLHRELATQHEQLERRQGMEAVRTWSGRSRATLLVDPGALGRLRWLLLTSHGVAPPEWLASALTGDVRGD